MEERSRGERNLAKEAEGDSKMTEARYLYGIVEGNEEITLGNIGIEGSSVYTIPYQDLCAVVHNCLPEPYKSKDKEKVNLWLTTHEKVVEVAWERFGTVLPLGFDTIIKGEEGITPDENMKKWLKDDYENLRQKLGRLKDRAEFGVQVFWDPKIISEGLIETNPEIKKLSEEIKSKSKGLAYMYKQKLENLLKKEIEKEADRYFKDFYEQIKRCVDEIKVEKTKKAEDERQMLMNLSCLLPKEASKKLGEELENIDALDGFSVRYT
ncbi:MAG: GvpL/GvpF family gas vesicle protein, partial [Thermodesulfovibrionia bacterium]|nr:GvpL/GvpF family gas vesicle protein [Thermodesulfovibrionia bacterium]